MKGSIRLLIVLCLGILFTVAVFFLQCTQDAGQIPDIRGEAYTNETTCANCHKNINNTYVHTAHFNTSSPITGNKLPVEGMAAEHSFIFNDSLKVTVDKRADGVYQTTYQNNKPARTERFDVAFGANVKAQTFGYWKGNSLNQLPLSYFKIINNWANSPGFPANVAYYDRQIISRCFECHGSFVEKNFIQTGPTSVGEELNKNTVIYGIDCQRCHGPAAQHVQFHLDNPATKTAKYIVAYSTLNRDLKVNMCAVCHNGNDIKTERSTFAYKPGDDLASFYDPYGRTNAPDVHGNQTSLLTMSKCYINSANLTCTSCHDVHQQEKHDPLLSAQKCLACHKTETHNYCKMAPALGNAITSKCIDCHMPAMPSKLISFKMSAQTQRSSYLLHTHQIAVYPDQTQQIIALLKTTKKSDLHRH